MNKKILSVVVSIFVFTVLPLMTNAQQLRGNLNIPAGQDSYHVSDAGFNLQIPADFFGPGSNPFDGTITCQGNFDSADTVIERKSDISLQRPSSTNTVEIEMVQLSLVSCQPIVVTFSNDNQPVEFSILVNLQTVLPGGEMNISLEKTNGRGGTFDALLPVQPIFVFTRVDSGDDNTVLPGDCYLFEFECNREGEVVIGDNQAGDTVSLGNQMFEFSAHDVAWSVCQGTTSDFCPDDMLLQSELGWMNLIVLPTAGDSETQIPSKGPDSLRAAADKIESSSQSDKAQEIANLLRIVADTLEAIQEHVGNLPKDNGEYGELLK